MKKSKQFKGIKTTDAIGKAIDAFLNTGVNAGPFEGYSVINDALIYRMPITTRVLVNKENFSRFSGMVTAGVLVLTDTTLDALTVEFKSIEYVGHSEHISVRRLAENVIARRIRLSDQTVGLEYVGNSAALDLIGRKVAFGRERLNRNETEIQQRLSKLIPMIPFNVFDQARLSLDSMRIIERGKPETVTRKVQVGTGGKTGKPKYKLETVHFTGASLFSVGDMAFLFDIDRREIEHQVFNPFLVKLPFDFELPAGIAEAYELLKPQVVKDAERGGKPILRQGEWFFLPVTLTVARGLSAMASTPGTLRDIELRAGPNRPNTAQGISIYDGKPVVWQRSDGVMVRWQEVRAEAESYVTGTVKHTGCEHADLVLDGWYTAVPNTATESFTITGDID